MIFRRKASDDSAIKRPNSCKSETKMFGRWPSFKGYWYGRFLWRKFKDFLFLNCTRLIKARNSNFNLEVLWRSEKRGCDWQFLYRVETFQFYGHQLYHINLQRRCGAVICTSNQQLIKTKRRFDTNATKEIPIEETSFTITKCDSTYFIAKILGLFILNKLDIWKKSSSTIPWNWM